MVNREIATVENCIAEARRMQESGQYISGTVFHLLADEIERLRKELAAARDALRNDFEPGNQSNAYKRADAALAETR